MERLPVSKPSHTRGLKQASTLSFEWISFLILQVSVYVFLYLKRLLGSFQNAMYGETPTERDVLDFLLNSSLVLLIKRFNRTNEFQMHVPHIEFVLKHFAGTFEPLNSMKVTFKHDRTKGEGKLIDFYVDGMKITEPGKMLSYLVLFEIFSVHTKVHYLSDALAEEIIRKKITELYPSLKITKALHTALLSSSGSIFAKGFFQHSPGIKKSLLKELDNWTTFHHTGIFLFKNDSPFCRFVWKGRESVMRHLRHTKLNSNFYEYFFLTTVFHAIDHHFVNKFSKFKLDFDTGPTWMSLRGRLSTAMVFRMFIGPTLNPFYSNLIKNFAQDSVYAKIYEDLVKVDKECADVITASIMY